MLAAIELSATGSSAGFVQWVVSPGRSYQGMQELGNGIGE